MGWHYVKLPSSTTLKGKIRMLSSANRRKMFYSYSLEDPHEQKVQISIL